MKIAIIGNGIAAWCVNKYIKESSLKAQVLHFTGDHIIPATTLRSTAVNCLRATEKGISLLGDLIVDSYHEFEIFYNMNRPKGVWQSFEYQLFDKEDDKYTKRFKETEYKDDVAGIKLSKKMLCAKMKAYLIEPKTFSQSFALDPIYGFVDEVIKKNDDSYHLKCNSHWYQVDKIILCCGVNNKLFKDLITSDDAKDYLARSKPVKGDYLFLRNFKSSLAPMSIAFKNLHLIIRDDSLILGSTSENDNDIYLEDREQLEVIYHKIEKQVNFSLPAFEKFNLVCGIRDKGRKRLPFWSEVSDNTFMISGLYKNGFSFAFLAAKEITEKLKSV